MDVGGTFGVECASDDVVAGIGRGGFGAAAFS